MSKISFSNRAWGEYCYWQNQDKKTIKRINILLQDIIWNGYSGMGKPEPLSENLTGFWSRRIDDANRLVYRITKDGVEVVQCKGHYNNK